MILLCCVSYVGRGVLSAFLAGDLPLSLGRAVILSESSWRMRLKELGASGGAVISWSAFVGPGGCRNALFLVALVRLTSRFGSKVLRENENMMCRVVLEAKRISEKCWQLQSVVE